MWLPARSSKIACREGVLKKVIRKGIYSIRIHQIAFDSFVKSYSMPYVIGDADVCSSGLFKLG